ncbi:sulfotransferase 6B1-like [Spea bombifrons]|uniref:sulfotransferase 6B1-like n=1 Tax=Spea bombifrons TaxID=233779 RepID=UPI00234B077E|nr:sulfotransferase 6B1-like [Spea bombifrons]
MESRVGFLEDVKKMLQTAKDTSQDKLLFNYKGILFPTSLCSNETFKAMETFEAREDDVFLVAYPKCGSNWSLQLLHDMVLASYNKHPSSNIPLIEFGAPTKYEKLKEESSPRVLATHLYYDNIPQTFLDKKTKMLVMFRNPKDTAVSLYHFYNNNPMLPSYSSWDAFFPDFINGNVCFGSYFDQAVTWNKHIDDSGVLLMTFEEMKQDLESSVKKIAEFFGFTLTEEQVKSIANKGTFKNMKEKSKETHGDFGQVVFRKGDVGDWKNYFTEDQNQEMDAKFEACLAGTKLGELLKYNVYCK